MKSTEENYNKILTICKEVFEKKTKDYGTAWRILRLPSITDQIFIKARRIRSIQEKGESRINEDQESEFLGIINYCLIGMIQMGMEPEQGLEIPYEDLSPLYDQYANETRDLLFNKNHDYDEAWKEMRISSITDIILMKILRIKQIEDNEGKTLISEGIKANFQDILNYSVFCMIKIKDLNN